MMAKALDDRSNDRSAERRVKAGGRIHSSFDASESAVRLE